MREGSSGEQGEERQLIVVGVGASAGGLDALFKLFSAAGTGDGVAWVVVQHLSLDHKSLMTELLGRHTLMSVVQATDGIELKADTVYLMPPQQDMTFSGGRLLMQNRKESAGVHHPIDFFFASLAAELGPRAAGVVLSGTGRDGAQGVLAIHEAGGVVVAQSPATAGFDGMPNAAIESGGVDMVAPPEQIAAYLTESLLGLGSTGDTLVLREIVARLSRAGSVDFSQYKSPTLFRRIQRRMEDLGIPSLRSYLDRVTAEPAELDRLGQAMLIGVSSFFRDTHPFERLAEVLPALWSAPGFDGTLRAWCPACASGQEAYSLAILVAEAAERSKIPVRLRLFATDVDPRAIERASAGWFDTDMAAGLTPERRERWFEEVDGGIRVRRSLRQSVVFGVHNALKDPPFSKLDLVSCRNFMIYLQPQAQRSLLTRCAVALRPGGLLMIGASETLGDLADAFDVVDTRARIHRRRAGVVRSEPLGTIVTQRLRAGESSELRRILDDAYRTLVKLDSPLSIVLNPAGVIVHTTGDAHPFFALPIGPASLDAVRLARGSLSTLLSAGLARSRREVSTVEYRGVDVRLTDADEPVRIDLRIVPLAAAPAPHHLVSIRLVAPPVVPALASNPTEIDLEQIEALHHELDTTRENLHAAIEELETTNEELQATNEELLASNEELQSTNEELQATNEELYTANAENERRIGDLIELHSDIDNLFRSTEIGTLFLDDALAVRKFTPAITRWTSLLDRDVGRPLAHVRHTLAGVDLVTLASRVLVSGEAEDVPTTSGDRHLLLRAVPYFVGATVRGVLISFVDVTELASVKAELEGVLDALPETVAVIDAAGVIRRVNQSWRLFSERNGGSIRSWKGQPYFPSAGVSGLPDADAAEEGVRSILQGKQPYFSMHYRCDSPTEERHFLMHVRALKGGGAVISHVDVSPTIRVTRQLERSLEVHQRLMKSSSDALLVAEAATESVLEANPAALSLLSSAPQSLGDALTPIGTSWRAAFEAAMREGEPQLVRAQLHARIGESADANVTVWRYTPELVILQIHDAWTERSAPDRAARTIQSQKMESLGLLAGGVAHELNNVLNSIVAVTYAHRTSQPADTPLAEDLDTILAACRRGGDLTRSLLGFARGGSVARERFSVGEVAREITSLIEKSLPAGISIDLQIEGQPVVLGDRSQVGQALMNLCMNSVDAVRGRGRVKIEVGAGPVAGREGSYAWLRVSDDGVGMEPSTRERAFEPFFTTKARGEGTGLGLSMVYGVGKSHGGWVDLVSQPGVGTTVTLRLPVATEGPTATPAISTSSASGRVLIVDDDALLRRSMLRLLERQGFVAEVVESGLAALRRVEQEPRVDVLVMDIAMPDLDGIQTLHQIRERHQTLPVLLYTGNADRVASATLELDRFTGFCTKPVDPAKLATLLQDLLARPRGQPQL